MQKEKKPGLAWTEKRGVFLDKFKIKDVAVIPHPTPTMTYLFFNNKSMAVKAWHLNTEQWGDEAKIVFIRRINIHRK